MTNEIYLETIKLLRDMLMSCPDLKENVYLVGGCVRDLELGLTPKDIDLCIDYPGGTDYFIEYLKRMWSDVCFGFAVFPKYGTAKFSVRLEEGDLVDIECVIPRVETYNLGPRKPDSVTQSSISEDAKRRDFCCNALYKNLWTGDILDPTGKGISDCRDRILRTPLDPIETFKDDPLRMLRAIRFSCTKEFMISPEVRASISWIPEYDLLSYERIRDEFWKILMSPKAIFGIRELIWAGLMGRIIPELQEYKDFDQHSKYHSLGWLEHTLAVLEKIIEADPYCPIEPRLAGLCHDITKPTKYQVKPDGDYSYHEHEIFSAERTKEILRNLKFSEDIVESVAGMVRNHMCIKPFYNYETHEYTGKPKKTREILRLLGSDAHLTMLLIDADNLSHAPEYCMPGQVSGFWEQVMYLKSVSQEPKKINISGNYIMSELGIPQGKLVGTVKKILQGYLDNNPELSDKELIEEYLSEFGDKKFWVVEPDIDETQKAFLESPEYGTHGFWWSSCPGDIGLPLQGDDIVDLGDLNKVELLATLNPVQWRMLVRDRMARELVGNISKEISDLEGSFMEISDLQLSISERDVAVKIKWSDGRETEII